MGLISLKHLIVSIDFSWFYEKFDVILRPTHMYIHMFLPPFIFINYLQDMAAHLSSLFVHKIKIASRLPKHDLHYYALEEKGKMFIHPQSAHKIHHITVKLNLWVNSISREPEREIL